MKKVVMGLLMFVVAVRCGAIGESLDGVDENAIQYSIQLKSSVDVCGEEIMVDLLLTNTSKERKSVSRASVKDFVFKVCDSKGCEDLLELRGLSIGGVTDRELYLQPQCSLLMPLTKAIIKPLDNNDRVPFGKYTISASWNKTNLSKKQLPSLISNCVLELVEYPLSVHIEASSRVFTGKDPFIVTVAIKNLGNDPVRFINYFHPYINNFGMFVEKEGVSNRVKTRKVLTEISLVTPQGSADWITLYPNESIITDIDIGREIIEYGKYNVHLTYNRPILLLSSSANPTYTKQHLWKSNKIKIMRLGKNIEDRPRNLESQVDIGLDASQDFTIRTNTINADCVLGLSDEERAGKIMHCLKNTPFPSIEFNNASIDDVALYLTLSSKQRDPKARGVKFIVRGVDKSMRVTCMIRDADLNLYDLLNYILKYKQLDCVFQEDSVVIIPKQGAVKVKGSPIIGSGQTPRNIISKGNRPKAGSNSLP